ncbi:hypothetical protein [Bradyrhizobium sp. WSM2254]|uniref:hypothetical protein n=1 Tax=Bradyrhizobium sp. WSM2254 TaxID=1188263 RepID=UPI00040D9811|nr:hypothetical protein [Bradyrhizobium sp. WSM2254]
MAKTCIICGKRAGSGEHVFPAVLGGRRVNNGIYCHAHNQGFGPLAKIIGNQLKPINALLAVRPDHKKKAEPFNYTSPEGEELVIFDGVVKHADPSANTGRPHIQLVLGRDDGLRAVAYIAMTFFAAYFQEHARKPELQAIKDYLLGTGKNDFIWWELGASIAGLPPNPFPFGHTVVLTSSAGTGRAMGYVSFFGALNFGTDFGAVPGLADRTVIIFIDPHADAAPNDIKKEDHAAALIELSKPNPLHAHLAKIVSDGIGQRALQGLLERIEEWKFAKEMTPVLEQFNRARSLPPDARKAEIAKLVELQVSRIYRIMSHLAEDFAGTQNGPGADQIASILKRMVKTNPPPGPTFDADGDHVMGTSIAAVVRDLDAKLGSGDADMEYLFRLFSGGSGAGIIGKIMFDRAQAVMFGAGR